MRRFSSSTYRLTAQRYANRAGSAVDLCLDIGPVCVVMADEDPLNRLGQPLVLCPRRTRRQIELFVAETTDQARGVIGPASDEPDSIGGRKVRRHLLALEDRPA